MNKICNAQTDDTIWEQINNLEVKFSSHFHHFSLIKSDIQPISPFLLLLV